MWTTALFDHSMIPLQWGAVIAAAFVGAMFDIATRRIPNPLSAVMLVTGLAWAWLTAGPAGLADGALGAVILSSPYVLLFVFASGGAGDAKLLGSLGVWLGTRNAILALVCVAVSGALMAICFALASKRLGRVLANIARLVKSTLVRLVPGRQPGSPTDMRGMPYAPAIFVGVCVAAIRVFM